MLLLLLLLMLLLSLQHDLLLLFVLRARYQESALLFPTARLLEAHAQAGCACHTQSSPLLPYNLLRALLISVLLNLELLTLKMLVQRANALLMGLPLLLGGIRDDARPPERVFISLQRKAKKAVIGKMRSPSIDRSEQNHKHFGSQASGY